MAFEKNENLKNLKKKIAKKLFPCGLKKDDKVPGQHMRHGRFWPRNESPLAVLVRRRSQNY